MAWWAALGKAAGGLMGSGGGKQGGGGNMIGQAIGGITQGTDKLTGAAIGVGQSILGAIQKKKADAMLPSGPSAAERALISETSRMRKAAQTNMPAYMTASNERMRNKMFKYGGGRNMGAITTNMQNAMEGISQQSAQQAAGLLGSEVEQQRFAGNVVRDVQMLRSARMSADAAANTKAGFSNLMGAITPTQKADTGSTVGADGLTATQAIESIKNRGNMKSKQSNTSSGKFQGAASKTINSNLPKNMGGMGNGLTNLLK
jgi:hypothetical protein